MEIGNQALELFESIIDKQGGTIKYVGEIDLSLGRKYQQESILIPVIIPRDGSPQLISLTAEEIENYTQRKYGRLNDHTLDELLQDPLISRTALEKELTRRLEQHLNSSDLRIERQQSIKEFEAKLKRSKASLGLEKHKQEIYVELQSITTITLRGLSPTAHSRYWEVMIYRSHPESIADEATNLNPVEHIKEIVSKADAQELALSQN